MKIQKKIIEEMTQHAKRDAPIEACGYLAWEKGVVMKHYELPNMDRSEEHFSFDPKDQFAVLQDVRKKGLELCAVYHSHPSSPPRPSAEDIKLAHDPNLSYVIISLFEGSEHVKSFRIKDEKVTQENLEVVGDA